MLFTCCQKFLSYCFCRIATHNSMMLYILEHASACPHNSTFSDFHAHIDISACSNPSILTNADWRNNESCMGIVCLDSRMARCTYIGIL